MKNSLFFLFNLLFVVLIACASTPRSGTNDIPAKSIAKLRKNCWQEKNYPTLLSVMQQQMQRQLEPEYVRDNYMQTFGCAYEEVDIEKNAIQAVYRAILQSLKNRNVEARDDLLSLLRSRPPRPDNLEREYVIYVNLPGGSSNNHHQVASYQIKILDLEIVHTVESPTAIWTRIASRFSHREDHYRALPIREEKSDFVRVIQKAQNLLKLVEKGKFSEVRQQLKSRRTRTVSLRSGMDDLVFGDQLRLIDLNNSRKYYPGIYLGKGILFAMTPSGKPTVLKFGEEKLLGLRIDFRSILRPDPEFESFGYKAPETILQCLFLKSKR